MSLNFNTQQSWPTQLVEKASWSFSPIISGDPWLGTTALNYPKLSCCPKIWQRALPTANVESSTTCPVNLWAWNQDSAINFFALGRIFSWSSPKRKAVIAFCSCSIRGVREYNCSPSYLHVWWNTAGLHLVNVIWLFIYLLHVYEILFVFLHTGMEVYWAAIDCDKWWSFRRREQSCRSNRHILILRCNMLSQHPVFVFAFLSLRRGRRLLLIMAICQCRKDYYCFLHAHHSLSAAKTMFWTLRNNLFIPLENMVLID